MSKLSKRTFWDQLLLSSCISLLTSSVAHATESASGPNPVAEVVVTAEKQQTTVQSAPLAITAVSGQVIEDKHIMQLTDLNGFVPSLTVAKSGGFVRVLSIRGVGFEATDNLSAQPGTAFHIDGVYIASPWALQQDFLDLQRLEVLRGPQGTVFGQNATGGVINAITNKPSTSGFSGMTELSGGTYNLIKATSEANVPINDTLAARLIAQKFSHSGFAKETGLGDTDLDDANSEAVRGAVLWQPTSRFSADIAIQYFNANQHGAAQKNIYDPNPDPREITQDYPNRYKLAFFMTYADLDYDLGLANFKSLTSYQTTRQHSQIDVDRLDYQTLGYYDVMPWWNHRVNAFSQEFNLTSKKGGRIDYIVGAYFLDQRLRQDLLEFSGTEANPVFYVPPVVTAANKPANLIYQTTTDQERQSYAIFGQSTVHVTEKINIVGGLRYSIDRMGSVSSTNYMIFGPAVHTYTLDHATTGKLEVDYRVTPTNMVYASVSRGYKPGGVSNNSRPLLVPHSFQPEYVWAYELGNKNRFLNNRLMLNAAAFYYDYTNLQYQEEDPRPFQGGVANLPKVHIWGAEFEGTYQASDALRFDGNITTLGGRMVGTYFALDPTLAHEATLAAAALGFSSSSAYTIAQRALQVRNTDGNTPPKLPNVEGRLAMTYTVDIGRYSVLRSTLEGVHRGKFQYRIFNDGPIDVVPAYDIANLYFEFKPDSAHWTLSLSATNLFDRAGVNARYSNPFGSFTTSQEFIPPRQVIGTVKYDF